MNARATLTRDEIKRLRLLLGLATPRPWVFDLVEPSELSEPDAVAWTPSHAHHTVVGWEPEDRDLVLAALRLLPRLLDEVDAARALMERLDDAGLDWGG